MRYILKAFEHFIKFSQLRTCLIGNRSVIKRRVTFRLLLYSYSLPLSLSTWFTTKNVSPNYRYWQYSNVRDVILAADDLYMAQKYMDAYELLNRVKYRENVDVLWRIARCLYKLSIEQNVPVAVQKNMIAEASDIMSSALVIAEDDANVHKWIAIILDCKFSLEGVKAKIHGLPEIKYHISKAVELDSTQTSLLFMLGKMCYDLANLSWFQRQLANTLFAEVPESTFQTAYDYFFEAEKNTPGFYIGNLVMLGKTAMKLGKMHRARYYFTLATQMTVINDDDKKLQAEAVQLAKSLAQYDISQIVFEDVN